MKVSELLMVGPAATRCHSYGLHLEERFAYRQPRVSGEAEVSDIDQLDLVEAFEMGLEQV